MAFFEAAEEAFRRLAAAIVILPALLGVMSALVVVVIKF